MKKTAILLCGLLMICANCLSQNRSIRLSGAFVQGRALYGLLQFKYKHIS